MKAVVISEAVVVMSGLRNCDFACSGHRNSEKSVVNLGLMRWP